MFVSFLDTYHLDRLFGNEYIINLYPHDPTPLRWGKVRSILNRSKFYDKCQWTVMIWQSSKIRFS